MDNNNQQTGFSYTYSAKDTAEIKKIREKYVTEPKEEDKMALLRRLDASVTQSAQALALAVGIVGVLILGFGMSLCMSELSQIFGTYEDLAIPIGIITGVAGGILASLAYPIYSAVVRAKRKKLAPQIISLADELMT